MLRPQPSTRRVLTSISRLGLPWSHAPVLFELDRASYTPYAQLPLTDRKPRRVYADEDGNLSVNLWVSAEGAIACRYICTLPDGLRFPFYLPPGSDPIELSVLREANAVPPPSPQYPSIIVYVDSAIAAHNAATDAHEGVLLTAQDAADAIAAHNGDANAHPNLAIGGGSNALEYEILFTDASLSIAGLLPILHGLGSFPSSISVWTGQGVEIKPAGVQYSSTNAIAIDLKPFRPLVGQWRAVITAIAG